MDFTECLHTENPGGDDKPGGGNTPGGGGVTPDPSV